jgi:ATP-binding cassette subfamily B protein
MNKFNVLQRGFSDCGPACLASVAAYYGLFVSLAEIQKNTVVNKNGTTINELILSAKKLGFIAKGAKGNIESIKLISKPFIALLKLRNSVFHFVSIIDLNDSELLIMDPALGKTKPIRYSEFLADWTGVVVLLEPGNDFVPGDYRSNSKNKSRIIDLIFKASIALVIFFVCYMLIKGYF